MSGKGPKYHHLIPQTYLSAWCHNNGTLKVEFKDNPGVIQEQNKRKIGGLNDFYSIKAGMPICTLEDANKIFASVLQYTVTYNGDIITNSLDLNKVIRENATNFIIVN